MDINSKNRFLPLKNKAISGSFWALAGFGGGQIIRLCSNLILTRLLFPEVFGLMALVQVVISGIQMLSDVGISTSVVRDKRGDDPDYLNTAWTLQIIRGAIIWVLCWIVAYPLASFYEAPELSLLIPVVGLSALIHGFYSPSALTLKRHIKLRRLISWELTGQFISVITTLILAWYFRSIWAIALGGLFGSFATLALSYRMLTSYKPRFSLDTDAVANIYNFGKWIFVSSFITFFINKGDVLVLGVFLTKQDLGVFAIAAIWSRVILELLLKVNQLVLLPIYSDIGRDSKKRDLLSVRKIRMYLLLATLPMVWALVIGGEFFIDILYDSRYSSAGWMLQVLAVGTIGSVITVTTANALLAFGDSFGFMLFQATRGLLLLACMIIGSHFFGVIGLIAGISASKFLCYPMLAVLVKKHKVWWPSLDVFAVISSVVVIGFGVWILNI
ncbi:MAG: oligosaccharide flippase family protein [Porticoccaceae bacterium]|nr:oligosaccharide flippase family protein [Porticoccaceae bacterium]